MRISDWSSDVCSSDLGSLVRRFRAGQGTHLQAVTGVVQATLEADFGVGQALQRGAQACGVHEGEHAVQALVRRANQETGGRVDVYPVSGVAVDAHLVFSLNSERRISLTDGDARAREQKTGQ